MFQTFFAKCVTAITCRHERQPGHRVDGGACGDVAAVLDVAGSVGYLAAWRAALGDCSVEVELRAARGEASEVNAMRWPFSGHSRTGRVGPVTGVARGLVVVAGALAGCGEPVFEAHFAGTRVPMGVAEAWPWNEGEVEVEGENENEVEVEVEGENDEVTPPACPDDMRQVGAVCMDRWEAPNTLGEPPLVMYTFTEGEAWCGARNKRLCFDDEWLAACAGPSGLAYPYGNLHVPGRCNDAETWRQYTQSLLNGWPASASAPGIATLDALLAAVRAYGTFAASQAADHIVALYQGTAAGDHPECVGDAAVEDLVGNVEEWVRRRDGGDGPSFSGALVGRYWAESRTCQSHVTVHGNAFRFYEIGFRCCQDIVPRGD